MPDVTLEHFKRAAVDIGSHGDNETLPFDKLKALGAGATLLRKKLSG